MNKKLSILLLGLMSASAHAQYFYRPYYPQPVYSVYVQQPQVKLLSYEELRGYSANCGQRVQQLAELRNLQQIKNFDPDPDKLSDSDREYNSRLKAIIWWYSLHCSK